MTFDVPSKPLKEVCQFIKDGDWIETKDQGESGYRLLQINNVGVGEFVEKGKYRWVTQETFDRLKCTKIEIGDVLVARMPEPTGRAWFVDELGWNCITAVDVAIVRTKPEELDARYCSYFLNSPRTLALVESLETGTTRKRIRRSDLADIEVPLPDIAVQRRIASVLSGYDRKIRLNRQTNQTLEQIAQAIFKSWFVDFEPVKAKMSVLESGGTAEQVELAAMSAISAKDEAALKQLQADQPEAYAELAQTAALFPSVMEESELGAIPEGWGYSEIGNEVIVAGGGTPSTKNSNFWEDGSIPWTTPKDLSGLSDKVLLNTERKITPLGLKKISSGLLPINTVLMSSRAPVGYLALAKIPVAVNQGYIAMKCTKDLPPEYVIQWCAHYMDDIKQRAGGTTFAEISKTNFKPLPVIVPSADILNSYKAKIGGLYDLITNHVSESLSLSEIRDSLLPKLLSGDLPLNGD